MMQPSNLGLPAWVLIGAVLGLLTGVFLGDYAAVFAPIGAAYVMLLQVAVFPYLICSLLHGLGSLDPSTALRLFRRGWIFYVLAWGMTFAAIFILASAIPPVDAPAIIDATKTRPAGPDILTLLLPADLFTDLTRNYVPAVVVFSILYGIAIQRFPKKESLLEILALIRSASTTFWNWVVLLAPFAVFALFAETAGTLDLNDLEGLILYIGLFLIGTLVLAFWVLPAVMSAFAPISPREVLREIQSGILIAVVTTLSVVALPFIMEAARKLATKCGIESEDREDVISTTLSVTYPLGQLGNFFVYLFMLFAVYFFSSPLHGAEKALLPPITLVSCIGSPTSTVNAVSFLSSWLQFPATSTQLYVETMTVTRYGQVVLSVVGFAFLTILVTVSYYGRLRLRPGRLALALALPALVLAGIAAGGARLAHSIFPERPDPYDSFALAPSTTSGIEPTLYRSRAEVPDDVLTPLSGETVLDRIERSGRLRVGYNGSIVPFSYFNRDDELVGYDVAFAYDLARSLNAELIFVPFEWTELEADLEAGRFDIAMAGVYATDERIAKFDVSRPYLHSPVGLIVPAGNARRFLSRAQIADIAELRIAIFNDPVLKPRLHRLFPKAEVVIVPDYAVLPTFTDFDAAIWSFEQASALASAHPRLSAVLPKDMGSPFLFAYLMPPGSPEFLRFVNYWLELKEVSGFTKQMRDYWVHGKSRPNDEPRWSVIRNVLHWVD